MLARSPSGHAAEIKNLQAQHRKPSVGNRPALLVQCGEMTDRANVGSCPNLTFGKPGGKDCFVPMSVIPNGSEDFRSLLRGASEKPPTVPLADPQWYGLAITRLPRIRTEAG